LTASAASPVVAATLAQIDIGVASAPPRDIAPAPADDPRGAGLASLVLPLAMAGMVIAVVATLFVPLGLTRAAAAGGIALIGGAFTTLIAQSWLGVIEGDALVNWSALTLIISAVALPGIGLAAVIGRAGLGLAAAAMILLGNAFSGITSSPEMLPSPAAEVGQFLPPGAGGSLLRSTGLFDGAGAAESVAVLASWALGGLGLLLIATARSRSGPGDSARTDGDEVKNALVAPVRPSSRSSASCRQFAPREERVRRTNARIRHRSVPARARRRPSIGSDVHGHVPGVARSRMSSTTPSVTVVQPVFGRSRPLASASIRPWAVANSTMAR
jgi:hypothetical protein